MDYKETGNKIALSVEELHNFAIEKLQQYDELVKTTGAKPEYDPYVDPIIYTTQEGKLVQVPTDIQQDAVKLWLSKESTGKEIKETDEEINKQNIKKEEMANIEDKSDTYSLQNILLIILIFLVILSAGYFFYKPLSN